ncbi:hypothetical protein [Flavobacterium humidisoli]|uniref:Uncharacterized protein n=1 Tax=Flavobacterium humidisoli TaxID=2937442 RepID=A0ABY4LZD8_9FLAO|nr:hypothetical protein [Flavobacterium humidisoli]UPZ17913.1 hypothetical protein M0M44_11305 [Flavobacterium humidisoli]
MTHIFNNSSTSAMGTAAQGAGMAAVAMGNAAGRMY